MVRYQVGVDEVGRGCVAGPVVAAAVILPPDYINLEIRDSKKISPKKRERLTLEIKNIAVSYGIGVICSTLVDRIGIVPATKQAMHIAISALNVKYHEVVIDAVKLNNITVPLMSPFKAEDSYPSVAAASIIAKVYRDELMDYLHTIHGMYSWDSNKGYGTKAHMDAIATYGITRLHRKSFLSNYL